MIKIKNLPIFKDNETKVFIDLLDYKDVPIFQDFLLMDDNDFRNFKDVDTYHIEALTLISRSKKKMKPISKAKKVKNTTTYCLSQKIQDVER